MENKQERSEMYDSHRKILPPRKLEIKEFSNLKSRSDYTLLLEAESKGYLYYDQGFMVKDILGRFWKIDGRYLPKSIEEYKNFKMKKWTKSFLNYYPELTKEQFFIEYNLMLRDDWKLIKEMIDLGVVTTKSIKNNNVLSIKDIHGRFWDFMLHQKLPSSKEEYLNFIPYRWTPKIQEKYPELTQKEFFIEYNLMLRDDWDIIKHKIDKNEIRIIKVKHEYKLQVKDIRGRFWVLYNNEPVKENYVPYLWQERYMELYPELTREQFFIEYFLMELPQYENIIKPGIANKFFIIKKFNNNLYLYFKDIYDRYWRFDHFVMKFPNTLEDFKFMFPKKYYEFYDISLADFVIDYYFKLRDDYSKEFEEYINQGKLDIKQRGNKTKNIYLVNTDKYGRRWNIYNFKDMSLKEIMNFHNKEYRRSYKKQYPELDAVKFYLDYTLEDIGNKETVIELLNLKMINIIEFNKQVCVKITNNYVTNLLIRIDKIAEKLSREYALNFKPFISNYIEPYEESKKILEEEAKLNVFKNPVVLNEENLEKMVLGHSIVWDLYDTDEKKSIYAGECRSGKYELEALKLYISKDKEGTIERRSKEYGYEGEQLIVERIFKRDFVVRLLAVGEDGECKFVRAYESVWNEECNDSEGCIEKQGF